MHVPCGVPAVAPVPVTGVESLGRLVPLLAFVVLFFLAIVLQFVEVR